MRHIRQAGLVSEDMNLIVDILNKKIVNYLTNQPVYKDYFGANVGRSQLIIFLQKHLNSMPKNSLRKFYKELNNKILYIKLKLEESNKEYETILKSKKLRELRLLFANVELDENELNAIPIVLKCMGIEYNKNIAFMIENEIYIRSRIDKGIEIYEEKQKNIKSILKKDDNIVIDQLMKDIDILEETIKQKDETIRTLDKIAKDLHLNLNNQDNEIGYFKELSEQDFLEIIKDLGTHSSEIKVKFKKLIEEFEDNEAHTEDKLYELWMKWTDDEVTVIDRVLKKSMYDEVIKKSDINELEYISENIMHRHLLSRIVLHLIYRRMSSQYLEEVLA